MGQSFVALQKPFRRGCLERGHTKLFNMFAILSFVQQTLKRGLFLAFCYTFVCLLYVSLYYTEPHSNNYGYDENIDRKSFETEDLDKDSKDKTVETKGDQLIVKKIKIKEVEPVTEVGTAPPEIDFVRDVLGNKVLKPNSTGMPWVNYRAVLTNEVC